jgi:hypothetical protein
LRIDPIVFVAGIQQSTLPRIADDDFRDMWFSQIVQPGGAGAFFKRDPQTASYSSDEPEDRSRFGFDDRLRHQFYSGIQNNCLPGIKYTFVQFLRAVVLTGERLLSRFFASGVC